MANKPTFQRSADTSLLVTLFSRAEMGDLITYEQITQTIGRDAKQHRQAVYSALRILHAETGAVFGCEPNTGYRRLDDTQIVQTMPRVRERVHRATGRALRTLAVVNTSKLSESVQRMYYAHLSFSGAINHASSAKSMKVIESKVNGSTQQLAVAMTLKALAE